MNPISRIFTALLSWFCLAIVIVIFIMPYDSGASIILYFSAAYIAPLVVSISFSIDLFVSRKKWKPRHKILKISIVYSLILVYIILHFESIVYAFTNIINIEQWFDSMPDYRLIIN